jgi:hypothetical protein
MSQSQPSGQPAESQSPIAWWWLPVELLILSVSAALVCWLMFSLLPLSVAVLTWLIALASFPVLRKRLQASVHISWTFVTWILLSILFYVLISIVGRAPFEWLLDWG